MPASGAWRAWIGAVLAGVALTALMTYPTVPRFASGGRVDTGDGRFSIWNVAWVAHAMLVDPAHVYDANIFHPHPKTLTYSELNLAAGLFAVPAYAATHNPIAAHNSAVLIALFLSFLCMWALTWRLTQSAASAIFGASAYTFSAYTAAHTAEIQLLMIFGFPLSMLAFHRLADRPTLLAGVWLGAALGLTGLASGYYGVFAGGLMGAAALIWAQRTPAYWKALSAAVVTLALVVLPALVPFLRARSEVHAFRSRSIEEVRLYAGTWHDYARSAAIVDGAALRGLAVVKRALLPHLMAPRGIEVLFPGLLVCGLSVVGLVWGVGRPSHRRNVIGYALIAGLAFSMSLGPDGGLYTLAMHVLPGSSLLRAPSRIGVVVIFALSLLAAIGLSRLAGARRWLGFACVVLLLAEIWVPWPSQTFGPQPEAYNLLATLPRGAVVELPFPYLTTDFHSHTGAMLRSTLNWQPLVNGYSDVTPEDFEAIARPLNFFPDPESFRIMQRYGVKYVIVRASDFREYRQKVLDQFPPYSKHLRQLTNDQDVWLYEIVSWP